VKQHSGFFPLNREFFRLFPESADPAPKMAWEINPLQVNSRSGANREFMPA